MLTPPKTFNSLKESGFSVLVRIAAHKGDVGNVLSWLNHFIVLVFLSSNDNKKKFYALLDSLFIANASLRFPIGINDEYLKP